MRNTLRGPLKGAPIVPLRWVAWLLVGAILVACSGLPARAEPATSAFFFANGVGIHYLVQGSAGPPVVLIHGWGLSARLNWEVSGIMRALAPSHRVIALDLPGYGSSDKPATPEAYGVAWSEDIGRLLDHLAIRKAHIVGWSMGGMVTLKFAVDHPDRMLTGALTGMGWMPEGGAMQQTWARRPDLASRGVSKLALTTEQVKAVRLPMAILVGSNDPIRQLYVEPLLAVRPDWPLVEIAGADHDNCVQKAEFRYELIRWLEGSR